MVPELPVGRGRLGGNYTRLREWGHRLGPRRFAEVHQLDIRATVARLSEKPFIRVESGAFVGRFGDQEYELGPTEAGLVRAIRRMSQLRREMETEVA
jgi:hypothetical protein